MSNCNIVYLMRKEGGMRKAEAEIPNVGKNQVLIRHEYIGVNDVDYGYLDEDVTPGVAASGTIIEIGENVDIFTKGQKVIYCTAGGGAYSIYNSVDACHVLPLPEDASSITAATILRKGMNAHNLLRRTFFVRPKNKVLVHAADIVGPSFISALARHYGAKVVGTVIKDESINLEKKMFGLSGDWKSQILSAVGKLDVVYENIGKDIINDTIELMESFGLIANYSSLYNNSESIRISDLAENAIFITSARLNKYKKQYKELYLSAMEVFGLAKLGVFPEKPDIICEFSDVPIMLEDIKRHGHYKSVVIKV